MSDEDFSLSDTPANRLVAEELIDRLNDAIAAADFRVDSLFLVAGDKLRLNGERTVYKGCGSYGSESISFDLPMSALLDGTTHIAGWFTEQERLRKEAEVAAAAREEAARAARVAERREQEERAIYERVKAKLEGQGARS